MHLSICLNFSLCLCLCLQVCRTRNDSLTPSTPTPHLSRNLSFKHSNLPFSRQAIPLILPLLDPPSNPHHSLYLLLELVPTANPFHLLHLEPTTFPGAATFTTTSSFVTFNFVFYHLGSKATACSPALNGLV